MRGRRGELNGRGTYGHDVPPRRPLLPGLLHGRQAHPVGPAAVDDEVAEQRAGEEQGGQEERAERVPCRDRPQAEQVQHLTRRRRGGGVAVPRRRA